MEHAGCVYVWLYNTGLSYVGTMHGWQVESWTGSFFTDSLAEKQQQWEKTLYGVGATKVVAHAPCADA